MRSRTLALQSFDGTALPAQVGWPTLCLAGSEDLLKLPHEVEQTAEQIPNATYQCIAGAGHSLLLESAPAFDRVIEFLRG